MWNQTPMKTIFFETQVDFRKWLEKNHKNETELLVGFYKVGSGKPSLTWSQSVDQALCFGWIDGVRRTIDEESYSIRFTPRRKNSNWSAINIKKVEALSKAGLMTVEGQRAYSFKKDNKSGIYTYENDVVDFDPKYENQFKENQMAWNFFVEQAPSYKRVTIQWIMAAKQEKTRLSRLEKTIRESELQRRIF